MCLTLHTNEGNYLAHYCDPGVNVDYDFEKFTFLDYIADGTKLAYHSEMPYDTGMPYYTGLPYYAEMPYYERPGTKE